MSKGNTITPAPAGGLDLAAMSPAERTVALFPLLEPVLARDPEATALLIAARLGAAESDDEALDPKDPESSKELIGVPLRIDGVEWAPSNMENSSLGVYAVIAAVDLSTGERLLISSGASKVVGQLYSCWRRDSFPFFARFETPANWSGAGKSPPIGLRRLRADELPVSARDDENPL